MKVGVVTEATGSERRVALVPESVARLKDTGIDVVIQAGAGDAAGFPDAQYAQAGATVEPSRAAVLAGADLIAAVGAPSFEADDSDVARMREGAALIAFLNPLLQRELLEALARHRISAFAMELVPRITRAQSMDALSSQATVAGYRAALVAATSVNKFFPMLMTAAGTIAPAKVLVLGAGVAGLQAIATARRLGAVVQGYDVRPEVKDQVESLGAQWVGLAMDEAVGAGGYAKELSEEAKQRAADHLSKLVGEADVVITTAQIPGRAAPRLITRAMVEAMRPGSVIVDLAAESGGNCELAQPGETVMHAGVAVIGPENIASSLPFHASQMYSRNVATLLKHVVKDGALVLDLEDEITAGALVTHEGQVVVGGPKAKAEAVGAGAGPGAGQGGQAGQGAMNQGAKNG
jgi:NAD(P) transhydrogenase subunit alpha